MKFETFISAQDLLPHLGDPDWAIIDCRFDLNDIDIGRRLYQENHIPGAVYAHLDDDLSSPVIPGKTSRHPLPTIEAFTQTLSKWGIDSGVQVVIYDNFGGGIAARLWWMLRWLGHTSAAVLDGSIDHWLAQGRPTKPGSESRPARAFTPRPDSMQFVSSQQVMTMRSNKEFLVVDSRSLERFNAEVEDPFDPITGHIPGAVSFHYQNNLTDDGLLKPQSQLRQQFESLLGGIPAEKAVFYCGSGVTANLNILALTHAGLGEALLYPGSWSEWITDSTRPINS